MHNDLIVKYVNDAVDVNSNFRVCYAQWEYCKLGHAMISV